MNKRIALCINGVLFASTIPEEAVANFEAFAISSLKSKKTWPWQKERYWVWQTENGKRELSIRVGSLDAYSITNEPPPPPNPQMEMLRLLKKSFEDQSKGDDWKKE